MPSLQSVRNAVCCTSVGSLDTYFSCRTKRDSFQKSKGQRLGRLFRLLSSAPDSLDNSTLKSDFRVRPL